jgi:small subunit ribosomal protein S1
MDDSDTRDQEAPAEDFASLLDQGFTRPFAFLTPGEMVEGRIVALGSSSLLVDVGQRSEASIALDEFTPDELQALSIGDVIEVRVLRVGKGGTILGRTIKTRDVDLESLAEAQATGIPIEGKVGGTNKGGYTVDLPGGIRGFVPLSQMDIGARREPQEYVGQVFRFRVIDVRGRDVVLSRASLLREEQADERTALLAELAEGQMRDVTVVKHESFGIFVDLGAGMNALVPGSELSWIRGTDELPPVGSVITVRILKVDTEGERPRISASLKQAGESPWTGVSERLVVGNTVRGKVTRLAAFGAFVEVAPGIEGLLHVSEITSKQRLRSAGDVLKVGQEIDVALLSVDPDTRRVSLSLKALEVREEDVSAEAGERLSVSASGSDGARRWASAGKPQESAPTTAMGEALRKAREKASRK